ncbi:hypothetical protein DYU11_18445 [Fibrisoma montanum]|uniref:Terminase large subunit gp17-like C-terminal domain-containing protein n=1 Tax=Fibrisoma montanum TaxID=2305895 RepID=A0A418M6G7_9BACT|nr:hypothetical protein [Fibrisoma montanum]RIV21386.1 hypothetical protein DYU11_18445 [Fibrisoma montanum]
MSQLDKARNQKKEDAQLAGTGMSRLNFKERQELQDYYDLRKKIVSDSATADLNESTEQRLARIERLKGNFSEFCQYYFPKYCKSPFGWFHKQAAKKITADCRIMAVLEWPRAHAKSVFANVMLPLYLKAKGELNGMIVVSNNYAKAVGLLIDIQLELEGNARYIADYGEQYSHGDWAEGQFATQDGIGFWAFGRGQSPRGTRRGEKRPDYIVVDDIDDKEIVKNQDRVTEAVDWVREDLYGCFDGKRSRMVIVGNRIHRASILAHLVGDVEDTDVVNPSIYHLKVFALENPKTHKEDQSEKGVPAWKENFARTDLEELFGKIGYLSSQREYFHKHIQVGRIFKNEHILWTKPAKLYVYDHIVTYNDPSFKDTKKNDYKAIVAVGKIGRYYDVLNMSVRQATTGAMVKAHYDLHEWLEENGARLVTHYMEANFIQDLILVDYVTESTPRGYMLPIRGDDRKKPDKYGRIENLTPLFERGVIRFNEEIKKSVDFRNFKDQLIGFPAAHDDGPDALEGGIWQINRKAKIDVPMTPGPMRRDNRY